MIIRSFAPRKNEGKMIANCILDDKELGQLLIKVNPRAKHIIFRTKSDAIYITVPPNVSIDEVKKNIEELRPKLRSIHQKVVCPLIDLNFKIEAEYFKLSLISGEHPSFLSRSEPGKMQIICPPNADFAKPELQAWLREVIEEALRRNAKVILPHLLYSLSIQHRFSYRNVKINSSRGRWGSCSAQGNINLSCFLMLLPKHLVEYVLLHELAHTREMNHGDSFHDLLNQVTNHQSETLRIQLKEFHTRF